MVVCYNCGKNGHAAKNCRLNKKRKYQNETSDDQNAIDTTCQLGGRTDHTAEHCHLSINEETVPKQCKVLLLSLVFNTIIGGEKCKVCKKFEHTIECPFGDPSINVRNHKEDHVPQVDLYLDNEKRKCRMVVAGSQVSVLKVKAVPPHIPIINDDTVKLETFIGSEVPHLGKISVKVFGCPMLFYVVSDDIGIRSDGALGVDFCAAASVYYLQRYIEAKGKKYPLIWFNKDFIKIPPKSCLIDYVNVLTSNLTEGYLPKLIFGRGIFAGDGIVSIENQRAYLPIFNYTKHEVEILRPCVEIKPVSYKTKVINYIGKASNTKLNASLLADESELEKTFESASKGRVKKAMELMRLDHLNNEELNAIKRWVENHNDLLHLSKDELNKSYGVMHEVSCTDDVPVKCKQANLSEEDKVKMKKVIDELLDREIIRVSKSPYDSPAYIVSDKPDSRGNKKWKLIVDYSKLNDKTSDDVHPIPVVENILNSLGGARYFSVLHLASGYHQIQMNPDDIPKTAFSTPDGHYEFIRMPAGLKNATVTFQKHLDNALSELQAEGLRCYLGSIIVFSKNLKNHEETLMKLATSFREVNLKLEPERCDLFRKEVIYLGYKVSEDGIRPNPEKLKTIENFPRPQNQSDIREFLGLTNFYRRFVKEYSVLARYLSDLLKPNKPFVWSDEVNFAFNTLKDKLCSESLLRYPNFSEPFTVTIESLHFSIGGTLSQGAPHNRQIIAYASRNLSEGETRYEIYEKELLAIIYCLEKFRVFISDKKFNLVAEKEAFDLLKAVKPNGVQNIRISKWASQIAGYEYREIYKQES